MPTTRTEYILYGVIAVTGLLLIGTIAMLWFESERGETKSSVDAEAGESVRYSARAGLDAPPELGTDLQMRIFNNVELEMYELEPPTEEALTEDLAYLRAQRAERTPDILAGAQRAHRSVFFMELADGELLQERIDAQNAVVTRQGFAELLPELEEYTRRLKEAADAPHVRQLDPELPAFETQFIPGSPSLPATRAYFVARVMGDLDPDRAAEYATAAETVITRLEIAGVAYPSANQAAKQTADRFYEVVSQRRPYALLREAAGSEWQ